MMKIVFNTVSESEGFGELKLEQKNEYVKPSLTVTKFMFEHDITGASLDTLRPGDNDANTDTGWWD